MNSGVQASERSLPDLSACEREPIQTPGAIEPHGVLLVLEEPNLTILQASANTLSLLGVTPEALLGTHLTTVLAEQEVDRLTSGTLGDGKRRYAGIVHALHTDTLFDGLVHRHEGVLTVELELRAATSGAPGNSDVYASLTDAMAEFDGPLPLWELCRRAARRIRHITGFDRVMVYRFLEDGTGSVVAEERREDLMSYLGLRYPASDIPAQARRLYLLNTLRLKPDVNAQRAAIIPALNPVTGTALDMTYCVLRAMSPVHDEYLRNMGVTASMSVSIVKDGQLWGLIACHHGEAKFVPHSVRITCEVLARVFSSHIAAAEEEDKRFRVREVRDLTDRIAARLRESHDVSGTLRECGERIMGAARAQGAAFCIGGQFVLYGRTPAHERMERLAAWLTTNQHEHVLSAERPGAHSAEAGLDEHASGLLSARIAPGSTDFILWFRPAIVRIIHWAGNPGKPVEETEAGKRISPRRSFEQWRESVEDCSEPWDDTDREFASALRQVVAEALLLEMNAEVVRLNTELSRSNIELDSFAYAASHDLQEPVRMIRSYAQLVGRRAGPDLSPETREMITTIENSALRMGNLISALLNYSQLGGVERRERKAVNLEDVLRWVLLNLNEPVRNSGATVTHDELPRLNSNQDSMGQLLQNLIGNAIKYRRPEEVPRVHVSAQLQGHFWHFSVRDNGQGFDPGQAEVIFEAFKRLHGRDVPGSGIGLATSKRIVEHHGGRIWAESAGPGRGATFWFTLPASD